MGFFLESVVGARAGTRGGKAAVALGMTVRQETDLDDESAPHPGAALAVAMMGFFVVALVSQVVNVALPVIRAAFGGSLSDLQWVVTAYTLAFSSLLLFGGTISEQLGADRTYRAGMVLFTVASVACGLAPDLVALVVARTVQGVGAALITPTSLALIRQEFIDPVRRTRAIAYWALGGSVAAAAGPVLGGALAEVAWRWIFWLNVPVGVAALWALSRVSRSPRRIVPVDWAGQAGAVLGLGGLTFVIIEGSVLGWLSVPILLVLAAALVGAMVFVVAQMRGVHPMVPFSLFSSRQVTVALLCSFSGMFAYYATILAQSLYFQEGRGLTPLATGLLFLPMTGLVAALNPLVARAQVRFGPAPLVVTGMAMMAVGLIGLTLAARSADPWLSAAMMVPIGLGGSFTVPPLTTLVLDGTPVERAGTASGVLNTFRQVGGSLGMAVVGAVIAANPDFMAGHQTALVAMAVLLASTALASLSLRRTAE